ncbi:hypothetical protein ACQZV8_11040 [Magnetococcales bacterium HHB-1]
MIPRNSGRELSIHGETFPQLRRRAHVYSFVANLFLIDSPSPSYGLGVGGGDDHPWKSPHIPAK